MVISIIIPVYNVKFYLKECLNSIINQSYKNLEIILVDDGSTDGSEKICDEYAAKDKRIVVIHKENGGVSDARNKGLDICTGDYISFVDSDDWLELDAYERILNVAKKTKADIVVCGYILEFKNGKINYSLDNKMIRENLKILDELFYDKNFPNAVWGKLYKKEIFRNLKFPSGKIYEDMLIKYDILKETDKIVILDNLLYHYRQRESSIMNIKRKTFNERIIACEIILNKIKKENSSLVLQAYSQLYKHYIYVIEDVYKNYGGDDKYKIIKELRKFIKSEIINICCNKTITIKAKIGYILCAFNFKLFILGINILNKKQNVYIKYE